MKERHTVTDLNPQRGGFKRVMLKLGGEMFGGGKVGIDPEAWDEIHDIFGNGEDYAWALAAEEEEEEEKKGKMEYKDVRMTGVY